MSEDFGEGLYNSCKDVKFGSMNTRAIDFVGAGAKSYKGKDIFQLCLSDCLFYKVYTFPSSLRV